MSLIGQRCKCSNVFSWLILISRKLDLKQAQCCTENKSGIRFNVQFWGCKCPPGKWREKREEWREKVSAKPTDLNHVRRTYRNYSLFTITYSLERSEYAPLAQLVEQLTLNQWVLGSSPCRCTKWPIGQVVKTAASHAVNIGSNPVWVTKVISAMKVALI